MTNLSSNAVDAPQAVLARLRAYCFPEGEERGRQVSAIRTTEKGEMRTVPDARWVRFTAEQTIEARRSSFRWHARYQGGSMGWISVTDAYRGGHGRLLVRLGGVIPVLKMEGLQADQAELQRYLASIALCPPIMLNHESLDWTAAGRLRVRVRDYSNEAEAAVEIEISEAGCPLACRADRPRAIGKQMVLTPWSATCGGFKECDGIRVPTQLNVSWQLPDGRFAYYRSEVIAYRLVY